MEQNSPEKQELLLDSFFTSHQSLHFILKLWFAEPGMDTPSMGNVGSCTIGALAFGSISNSSIAKDVWSFSEIKKGYN